MPLPSDLKNARKESLINKKKVKIANFEGKAESLDFRER